MLNAQNKTIVKRLVIEIVVFALLLASDLISKKIVLEGLGLEMYEQYIVVDGLFALYPCTNDGASFSIFSGQTGFLIALTAILLLALCALMIFNLIKKPNTSWLFRWSMLLIISGGLGNLYDRIFYDGEVRDFIQYMFLDKIWQPLFDSNFGVGNIADIYLVLGVFLICVYIVFDYKEGDLGILKPKAPKNLRTDEVPVEDSEEMPAETAEDKIESDSIADRDVSVSENAESAADKVAADKKRTKRGQSQASQKD